MKVEVIKEEKRTESKYPYIGEGEKGVVVLFHSIASCTILKDDTGVLGIGEHFSIFNEENFTPLKGKITLQND